MNDLILILLGLFPVLAIVAGLHDLTTMKIPNWISLLLIVGFFPVALMVGLSLPTVALHVAVGLLARVVGAGMFALNWIGGGDAKLIAASCLWLGVGGSGAFLLYTGVCGGGFCVLLLMARKHVAPVMGAAPGWVAHLMQPKGDIPYGVAIAAGALLAFPASEMMTRFSAGI
jgi:prepilin peptidase CpaA